MAAKADIRTVRVAGQELRVALMGPATAERTLLVFNGIGASLETVEPFAQRFERTRIVTFDVSNSKSTKFLGFANQQKSDSGLGCRFCPPFLLA
jgi:hypothetical protein